MHRQGRVFLYKALSGTVLANLEGVGTRQSYRPPSNRDYYSISQAIAEEVGHFVSYVIYSIQTYCLDMATQGWDWLLHDGIPTTIERLCYNFLPMDRRNTPTGPRAVPRRPRRQSSLPDWAVYGLGAFFVIAALFSAYLVYTTTRDFVASWGGPVQSHQPDPNGTVVIVNTPAPGETQSATQATPIQSIDAETWNGTDRVTILLMGIDQRQGETDTAYRTDSMMLVTIDPVGRTVGILSIPRDLYVSIPGFPDRDKITTANFKGDAYHLPGGGPQLAMDTIESNLGIRVNYYVRINFTAFETFVDLIGGIDVNNPYDIADPEYPDCCNGYDPFYLTAGPQHLDGATALKFARTRHMTGDDFGRAERQQMVVLAVRQKILSTDMLPVLFTKAPELLNALSGSYTTNLSLDQIASLALLAKEIPEENIENKVIDQEYIADFYTRPEDNQQVLILNIEKFRELRDEMFYTPQPQQLSVPNASDLLANESARVAVQNGTPTEGLAKNTADYLTGKGVNVTVVGNADRLDYGTTLIIDYTGKPYTAKWLADTFHVSSSSILAGNDPNSTVDVRVILGQDFILPSN